VLIHRAIANHLLVSTAAPAHKTLLLVSSTAANMSHVTNSYRLLPEILEERCQNILELARSYASDSEDVEAERLYQQALDFCERTFTSGHAQYVDTHCKFGRFFFENLKDFDRAMEQFELALEMCEILYRERGNKQTATALCGLGECHWELGELEKALPLYQRSLDIREAKLGEESLITLRNLQLLGRLCLEMDDPVAAVSWLTKSRDGLNAIKEKKGMDYDKQRMPTAAINLEAELAKDFGTIPAGTDGLPPVIQEPTKKEREEEWRRKREEQLRSQY
jgi:tetratricopeptide (TPR) repeat protein